MKNQNNLTTFNFNSQDIRTVTTEKGETLFVAKDVAEVLGYVNTNDALARHCKGVVKRYPAPTNGGIQIVRVINEPDLFRLILSSKLPAAQEFEKWVFEEVLPQIRKTGQYAVPAVANTSQVGEAYQSAKGWVDMATLFGVPKSIALVEATKYNKLNFGVDTTNMLQASPHMDDIPDEDVFLEPKELAAALGMKSPQAVNQLLMHYGFQVKDGKTWVATEAGAMHCTRHLWNSGSKSGYNLKWRLTFVKSVLDKHNTLVNT